MDSHSSKRNLKIHRPVYFDLFKFCSTQRVK